ncbi:KpsF/GutQ family sugar-phosphate isomerase [Candidatus Pelagibacter sp. HIMB1321]|uniref:KpsF/GutQ family sugar-phosphate isomerase n=1 Tax=Candidatus Pelagibacter sp. HIMB1321 TaxID=1388755 RepID=UPI000A07ECE4|nr:KpsF/GutQ family sugar-phosphate isomerase [Candidatus Pelagibacter sp. HIMB1321]SMF79742.1 arabinose-5-phosphate isomerase [Candidatus Pelagibacter sp. HIMB1321]
MPKINYIKTAREVISLEIKALEKLKKNIKNSFNLAVEKIANCQSKIILSGVGKSGLIANKIAATMSSVGSPAFCLSASDSSHGDLGSITKKDILILISYSGKSKELKNIIQYANRNRILLIGIMSKKDSLLYKASDIKLLIPQVVEAAGIVPTSSTTSQLALGDALAIAVMRKKRFGKLDFKKIHPSGSLGAQLKTVEDLMIKGNKIPFVKENLVMNKALKILTQKKLGVLIVQNNKNQTKGIITDGQVRRYNQSNKDLFDSKVSKIMTKNPISVEKDMLAAKALNIMNKNKITALCVHDIKKKFKTIGVLHVHDILEANIS